MEHHWGKEIKICTNEVPGVTNGHTFYIALYSKNILMNRNALIYGREHPWARRFKVVQMKSLGLSMAPPQGLKLLHSDIHVQGNA